MKTQIKLLVIFFLTVFLGGFLVAVVVNNFSIDQRFFPGREEKLLPGQVKAVRVIDGDTIEVNNGGNTQKVRYIGVDTPETNDPRRGVQCFGKEAKAENKSLVGGKLVVLEKDISETDKYNRLLRYVYLPMENGKTLFVNDYLIREGFAKASTFPPDVKYSERFLEAEREARENLKGLWGKCK